MHVPPRIPPRVVLVLVITLVAVGLLASCAGSTGVERAEPQPVPAGSSEGSAQATAPDVPADPVPAAPAEHPPAPALVARTSGPVAVYDAPGGDAPATTLPPATVFGSRRALLVVDRADDWLQVQLPARPNGSTGWIAAEAVELRQVDLSLEVDLAARTLVVRDGDAVVLATPVAVGAPGTPTPTGEFFVTDKLDTGDESGPYGPFAFGISAWSEILTEFAGGDGQVGIHGTNDPSSIGRDVSNGCVRVPNEVARTLNDLLPLGTPVTIR